MGYYLDGMTYAEINLYKYLQRFENEKFIVIPNLMIERKELGTNQYDFVILTDRGIFVIEYKDYKGAIYGNEYSKNWKVYYKNGYKVNLRNPVAQNQNHIKTLTVFLDKYNCNFPIFNVVVFGDKSSTNKIKSSVPVIKKEDIIETVNKNHKLLLEDENILIKIKDLLLTNNITNPINRKKHLEFIEKTSSNQNSEKKKKHNKFNNEYKVTNEYTNRKNVKYTKKSKKVFINKKFVAIGLVIFLWIVTSLGNDRPENNIGNIENNKASDLVTEDSENKINNESENVKTKSTTPDIQPEDESNKDNIILEEGSYVDETENTENNQIFLDIGIPEKKVEHLLGEPTKKEEFKWSYSSSVVTFNQDGKVNGWINNFNRLDSVLYKPLEGAEKLEIGLTKEQVRDLYGSPLKIINRDPNTWHYVNSNITFDSEGKVNGWLNNFNQLDSGQYKPLEGAEKLEIGLTKEQVRDLYGSPTKIISRDPNTWYYINSKIIFNTESRVSDWTNNYEQLDSGLDNSE